MTTAHHCVAEDIVRMASRERLPEPSNPLGMDGIEFVEYATSQPQAFGDLLQRMGFVPLARHRSREVMLYRQGPMNLIVNSHGATSGMPTVSAVGLPVGRGGPGPQQSLRLRPPGQPAPPPAAGGTHPPRPPRRGD